VSVVRHATVVTVVVRTVVVDGTQNEQAARHITTKGAPVRSQDRMPTTSEK
jgi:hypothetical protein